MASSPRKDASPGTLPKSQSPRSSPPPIEYAYMYETNNRPTELLDALLRAIARYITREIGDRSVGQLTPMKLAAFYKAVGGDYNDLFFETPPESISYMWQVTGCQHTLQPVPDDDFAPPTIPALTQRGFSRWESLEILLGPEEHVPFLQFAVRNWKLKHPETGQDFPTDLPKTVFPSKPDPQVDRWHENCANQLKRESSKAQESARSGPGAPSSRPEPDHGEPKVSYAHVRKPFQGRPPPADPNLFERPVSYNHVPGRHASGRPRPDGRGPTRPSPERYERSREERARERGYDDHERRRSFSDFNAPRSNPPPPSYSRGSTYLDPGMTRPEATRPEAPRRHSQPRHVSSDSSDDEPIPPRTSRRSDNSPPNRSRFADSSGSHHSPPASMYRHRSDIPTDDDRRRPPPTNPSLREKVAEKVSSMLPNGIGPDRPRNHNRPSSYNDPRPRRSREFQSSRLSRSYSDLESDGSTDHEDSDGEYQRRRRDRPRDGRGHTGDFDREEDKRDRQYLRRPDVGRRPSSHADMDRMDRRRDQPAWDPRLRDQSREERRRWEKRAAYDDDRGVSPMGGRRYPEAAYTKA